MIRNILWFVIFIFFIISCNNDCDDNPPEPLSFKLQWVDAQGNDMYEKKEGYKTDSLVAFYNKTRGKGYVNLKVTRVDRENNLYYNYIDIMPLVRKAYTLQLDSVFIKPDSIDIDTIILKVIKKDNDCFSSVYRFDKLMYNKKILSGVDSLYIIEK